MNDSIRVRFAPSPTGYLHIGGVRTALFNYLFARANRGNFFLRIEDTDRERSKPEFENEILDALKWIGLGWDGDLWRQSERINVYQKAADDLVVRGLAYRVEEAGSSAIKFKVPKGTVHFSDLIHGPISFDSALFDDLV